jgi:serine/threonine protein kinase
MNEYVDKQFANYRLIRMLGRGKFADVYLGEHIYLKTLAVVKILHERLTDSKLADFTTEARSIARLDHHNIMKIQDFNVQEQIPYLVMAYAAKGNLRKHHPPGSMLPLEMIVAYVKDVTSALCYAHISNVLHLNIKPENMLLSRNHEVLLSDFRISAVMQSRGDQSTPQATGMLTYMAPEQIQGEPLAVSDQYALAVVIYEWLSGNPPFKGEPAALRAQHLTASPPPLTKNIPSITPTIEAVVMKALAKEPKDRYNDVEEFAKALDAAFHGKEASPTIILDNPLPNRPALEPKPNSVPVSPIWVSQPTVPPPETAVRNVPVTSVPFQEKLEQRIQEVNRVDEPVLVTPIQFLSANTGTGQKLKRTEKDNRNPRYYPFGNQSMIGKLRKILRFS